MRILIFTSSSHWSLLGGLAMRMMRGEPGDAEKEDWECRCQLLRWDGSHGFIHISSDGFGWILKEQYTSVLKRRLCDSSPKLEDIWDPALVEGRLRPQADAGQVEVPGGEQAIQVQSINLWVIFLQDPKLQVCLGGFTDKLNMKLFIFAHHHLGSASLNSSLVLSRANACNKQLVFFFGY